MLEIRRNNPNSDSRIISRCTRSENGKELLPSEIDAANAGNPKHSTRNAANIIRVTLQTLRAAFPQSTALIRNSIRNRISDVRIDEIGKKPKMSH